MPFDGTDFPRQPGKPRRTARGDTMVSAAIILAALGLMLTPISLAALVDIIRYARGGP